MRFKRSCFACVLALSIMLPTSLSAADNDATPFLGTWSRIEHWDRSQAEDVRFRILRITQNGKLIAGEMQFQELYVVPYCCGMPDQVRGSGTKAKMSDIRLSKGTLTFTYRMSKEVGLITLTVPPLCAECTTPDVLYASDDEGDFKRDPAEVQNAMQGFISRHGKPHGAFGEIFASLAQGAAQGMSNAADINAANRQAQAQQAEAERQAQAQAQAAEVERQHQEATQRAEAARQAQSQQLLTSDDALRRAREAEVAQQQQALHQRQAQIEAQQSAAAAREAEIARQQQEADERRKNRGLNAYWSPAQIPFGAGGGSPFDFKLIDSTGAVAGRMTLRLDVSQGQFSLEGNMHGVLENLTSDCTITYSYTIINAADRGVAEVSDFGNGVELAPGKTYQGHKAFSPARDKDYYLSPDKPAIFSCK